MNKYCIDIEETMKKVYDSFNEKDRRRYAAVEAKKLEFGGITYISTVLKCDTKTILKGLKELGKKTFEEVVKIRKKGGGRKHSIEKIDNIDEVFLDVVKDNTAGSPMDENINWTNLTQKEISEKMKEKNVDVSVTVVKQLLKKHGFVKRKAQKKTSLKECENRNEQFENISRLKKDYEKQGNPIISMDTKKKEYLGNFYRDGKIYTRQTIPTLDHDFNNFSEGIVIPHGLYDCIMNKGFINIGTSHDTAEFACNSIKNWWENYGKHDYPSANSILILCDGGGSNSSRHYIFKEQLQKLVNEIKIEIRIAHYPPYCSKYNPIEHKMFPHVTRACQGVIFKSIEIVKNLMMNTKTKKGLKVMVNILNKIYMTGKNVSENFKKIMTLKFDNYLPKWNYTAIPQ